MNMNKNKREYPHANQKQLKKEVRGPCGKANEGNNVKSSAVIPRSFVPAASADTPGANQTTTCERS